MIASRKLQARTKNRTADGQIHLATEEEWQALVDRAARYYLGISGDEFVRAWERGEFENADRPEVLRVAMLLPIG
jgi:hypothetical protein